MKDNKDNKKSSSSKVLQSFNKFNVIRYAKYKKDYDNYYQKNIGQYIYLNTSDEIKDNLIFNVDDDISNSALSYSGMSVFGASGTAFIMAHGTEDGKIALPLDLKSKKKFSVPPEELLSKIDKLLPDQYKKVFTINCYGGKQNKFITESGRVVQSLHRDAGPITGVFNRDKATKQKVFALLTKLETLSSDVIESIYKDVYKGKFVSKSQPLKTIIPQEKLKSITEELINDKNKPKEVLIKKENIQPKPKDITNTSKPVAVQKPKTDTQPPNNNINKEQVKHTTKTSTSIKQKNIEKPKPPDTVKTRQIAQTRNPNIEKPIINGTKINIIEEKQKRPNFESELTVSKVKIDNNKPIVTEQQMIKKTLSPVELYDLNKNSNMQIQQQLLNTQQVVKSKHINTNNQVTGQKLDILANRKDMAMMTDIIKTNQEVVNDTATQIAKNICSSGNRYGKGAISIMNKVI